MLSSLTYAIGIFTPASWEIWVGGMLDSFYSQIWFIETFGCSVQKQMEDPDWEWVRREEEEALRISVWMQYSC